MHTGDGGFGTRWRTGIRGPSTLAVLGVAPVFWLLGNLGVIADAPLWTRVVVLLGAQFATITAYAAWPPPCDGWRRIARIGVHTFAIAAVIYDIGWGPTLAVGFLFGMAEDARISGSFEARAAIAWTVLAIGLGQGAIAVGFVPTLIPEPLVHGLALLSALGVAFSIGLLAWTMAQKDSAEDGLRRSDRRFRALVQHASDIILVLVGFPRNRGGFLIGLKCLIRPHSGATRSACGLLTGCEGPGFTPRRPGRRLGRRGAVRSRRASASHTSCDGAGGCNGR